MNNATQLNDSPAKQSSLAMTLTPLPSLSDNRQYYCDFAVINPIEFDAVMVLDALGLAEVSAKFASTRDQFSTLSIITSSIDCAIRNATSPTYPKVSPTSVEFSLVDGKFSFVFDKSKNVIDQYRNANAILSAAFKLELEHPNIDELNATLDKSLKQLLAMTPLT